MWSLAKKSSFQSKIFKFQFFFQILRLVDMAQSLKFYVDPNELPHHLPYEEMEAGLTTGMISCFY